MWTLIRLLLGAVWSGSTRFACMQNIFEKFARIFSRRHKQTTFSDAGFLGVLRVKLVLHAQNFTLDSDTSPKYKCSRLSLSRSWRDWNTSRYQSYLDITDLQNWGKNRTTTFHKWICTFHKWICNLKLKIYWKYCGKGEKLLLGSKFSSFPQYFMTCC